MPLGFHASRLGSLTRGKGDVSQEADGLRQRQGEEEVKRAWLQLCMQVWARNLWRTRCHLADPLSPLARQERWELVSGSWDSKGGSRDSRKTRMRGGMWSLQQGGCPLWEVCLRLLPSPFSGFLLLCICSHISPSHNTRLYFNAFGRQFS